MDNSRTLDPDDLLRLLLSLSRLYAESAKLTRTSKKMLSRLYERILFTLRRNTGRTMRVKISHALYLEEMGSWLLGQGKYAQAKPYLEKRLKLPFNDVTIEAMRVGVLAHVLYKSNPKSSRVAGLYRTYLARFGRTMHQKKGHAISSSLLLLQSWLHHKCPISESDRRLIASVLERCSKSLHYTPPKHIRSNTVGWINQLRKKAKGA